MTFIISYPLLYFFPVHFPSFPEELKLLEGRVQTSFLCGLPPISQCFAQSRHSNIIQNGYLNLGWLTVVPTVQNLLFSWDRTLGTGCFVICVSFGLDFRKKIWEFYRQDGERKANVSSFRDCWITNNWTKTVDHHQPADRACDFSQVLFNISISKLVKDMLYNIQMAKLSRGVSRMSDKIQI